MKVKLFAVLDNIVLLSSTRKGTSKVQLARVDVSEQLGRGEVRLFIANELPHRRRPNLVAIVPHSPIPHKLVKKCLFKKVQTSGGFNFSPDLFLVFEDFEWVRRFLIV